MSSKPMLWLAIFLALTLSSSALPNAILVDRSIDATTYGKLTFFSQFATAAYCPNNDNQGSNNVLVTCPGAVNCNQITADGVRTVLQFTGNTGPNVITDINGYVAIDDVKRLIVVAFRGTSGFRNIITDLRIFRIPARLICQNCEANAGFYDGYSNIRMQIYNTVLSAYKAHPSYQVVVTGHSLGGAIANFAAADLRNQKKFGPVDLYTYGAPRAGNYALANYITGQAPSQGQNYRVTHALDPVPRVPPNAAGYGHPYPQYFISTGTGAQVTASDISLSYQCCNMGDDVWVFTEGPDLNVPAHLWYFTNISSCSGQAINPQGVTQADVIPLTNGTLP